MQPGSDPGARGEPVRARHHRTSAWELTTRPPERGVPSRQPRPGRARKATARIGFLITSQTLQRGDRVISDHALG
jgi:hypothetical protein